MDLEAAKAEVAELRDSLAAVIDFFEALGLDPTKLEATVALLAKLEAHLEVLDTSAALSVLQAELRKTNVTLDLLRANLQSYPEPPTELVDKVDEAQAEVQKNLLTIKKVKKTSKGLWFAGLGALAIVAIQRTR